MNKTKKITQGAMMLAILGALILIDSITAFWFTEFVVLVAPIIIIMYSSMQSFKDGIYLSIGVLIISFILCKFEPMYITYIPVGVFVGIAYSFGIRKGLNKNLLALLSCVLYTLGEVIAFYYVLPLFGIPTSSLINEIKAFFNIFGSSIGVNDIGIFFSQIGLNYGRIVLTICLLTIILSGILKGLLIHILCLYLLRHFKIKDFESINLWNIKPNKIVASISLLSLFMVFFLNKISNDMIYFILAIIVFLGTIVLLYYGYIFITLYFVLILKSRSSPFVLIISFLIPILFIAILIIGFLYAVGPLRMYLEERVNNIKHE